MSMFAFAVVLVVLFGAGIGTELHKGLKEDKKYTR